MANRRFLALLVWKCLFHGYSDEKQRFVFSFAIAAKVHTHKWVHLRGSLMALSWKKARQRQHRKDHICVFPFSIRVHIGFMLSPFCRLYQWNNCYSKFYVLQLPPAGCDRFQVLCIAVASSGLQNQHTEIQTCSFFPAQAYQARVLNKTYKTITPTRRTKLWQYQQNI